ncbi:MAG: hypothetical protein Q8S84_07830 [bacterium]|nr:hypothetical protein [bacterium]MDP3381348.1 hypothetical protein [bacterium]
MVLIHPPTGILQEYFLRGAPFRKGRKILLYKGAENLVLFLKY